MADENKANSNARGSKSPSKKEIQSPSKQDNIIIPNGNASHTCDAEVKPRKRKDSKGGEGKSKENKAKRRKRMKDTSAPKHPLSGYVRFMNDHRERIKAENPKANFTVVTKILAAEWSKLGPNEKQQYLDAAETDKERYTKELDAYKQTDSYKAYTKKQREHKHAKSSQGNKSQVESAALPTVKEAKSKAKEPAKKSSDIVGLDIPIFTEDFLDHNKGRETELRQLRKSTTDYEQQNSILQTHLTNMQSAVDKLEVEVMQQMTNNAALKQHLEQLRNTLVSSLSHLPLPGSQDSPSQQSIDNYMLSLPQFTLSDHPENKSFISSVKSALNGLQFHV